MAGLIALVRDPAAINYLLICLYVLNAVRWGVAGSVPDVIYWIGAAIITSSVTFWR